MKKYVDFANEFLTKEYGLISAISKGCRKIKSKLRSVSTKLTYGYFHVNYKENGLSNIIAVDVIDSMEITKSRFDTY